MPTQADAGSATVQRDKCDAWPRAFPLCALCPCDARLSLGFALQTLAQCCLLVSTRMSNAPCGVVAFANTGRGLGAVEQSTDQWGARRAVGKPRRRVASVRGCGTGGSGRPKRVVHGTASGVMRNRETSQHTASPFIVIIGRGVAHASHGRMQTYWLAACWPIQVSRDDGIVRSAGDRVARPVKTAVAGGADLQARRWSSKSARAAGTFASTPRGKQICTYCRQTDSSIHVGGRRHSNERALEAARGSTASRDAGTCRSQQRGQAMLMIQQLLGSERASSHRRTVKRTATL